MRESHDTMDAAILLMPPVYVCDKNIIIEIYMYNVYYAIEI